MKILAPTLWLIVVSLSMSNLLAQAGFWLDSRDSQVNARVFDASGTPLEGPRYVAELWGGESADSLAPAISYLSRQRVVVPFLTGNNAGYFRDFGRQPNDWPSIDTVTPYLEDAWLQVRAWDTQLGSTYEQVAALGLGGYGASPIFTARGVDPRCDTCIPGGLIGLQSFRLLPIVPEPSTVALLFTGIVVGLAARLLGLGSSKRGKEHC